MYTNKSHKRTNSIKLRFSDFELDALNEFMDYHGGERAVVIREKIMGEVEQFLAHQERLSTLKASQVAVH